MNKKTNFVSGFTLVELMITVAIIAILTAIVMTNLTQPRAKARDAKRLSDLAQIQLAIELYFDKCKQYPDPVITTINSVSYSSINLSANNGNGTGGTCSGSITLSNFISKVPVPPASSLTQPSYDYYISNGNGGTKSDYILHVQTEYTSDTIAKDSLPNSYLSSLTTFPSLSSIHCYDSSSYPKDYCVGPK